MINHYVGLWTYVSGLEAVFGAVEMVGFLLMSVMGRHMTEVGYIS